MKEYSNLTVLSQKLSDNKKIFLHIWKEAIKTAQKEHAITAKNDVFNYGSKLFDQTVINLSSANQQSPMWIKLGKEIGLEKASQGEHLEGVLEIFILFQHRLWQLLRKLSLDINMTADDVFEAESRINLHIAHILESIAFEYVVQKEQAVVDLIEKIIR